MYHKNHPFQTHHIRFSSNLLDYTWMLLLYEMECDESTMSHLNVFCGNEPVIFWIKLINCTISSRILWRAMGCVWFLDFTALVYQLMNYVARFFPLDCSWLKFSTNIVAASYAPSITVQMMLIRHDSHLYEFFSLSDRRTKLASTKPLCVPFCCMFALR
eukprot:TRINITY_DN821_c0_g1_i3.p1 TRINITY_DN821_c0_g1~~TRINITY_DN821_c0_g1_i3.p1  ORF type:complete len:159 (+),score=18.29 TRINITY_DN821_c0_g1_i3:892-1368(+)